MNTSTLSLITIGTFLDAFVACEFRYSSRKKLLFTNLREKYEYYRDIRTDAQVFYRHKLF